MNKKKQEISIKLSEALRLGINGYIFKLRKENLAGLEHLEHFKILELEILFDILESLREELKGIKDLRVDHQFVQFNDKGDFENYEYCKNTFIDKYLDELGELDFEKIIQSRWFENSKIVNATLIFHNSILIRFNEIQKKHPQDYKVFTKKINNKISSNRKLKWKGTLSDLGYIFRNIADLGYFEIPSYSNGKHDLKFVAEILSNTFDFKGSIASLKEFMGEEGIKRDRMDTKFDNALSISSEKEIFHIPRVSKLN